MRTFRGPEEDVGGDFGVGPAPDAQEEDPPPLGLTPDPLGAPLERSSGRWVDVYQAATKQTQRQHPPIDRARQGGMGTGQFEASRAAREESVQIEPVPAAARLVDLARNLFTATCQTCNLTPST